MILFVEMLFSLVWLSNIKILSILEDMMKKFLALVDIVLFMFLMALVGVKNINDFALPANLYPWIFWGTIVLMVIVTWIVLPKKKQKITK